MEFDKPDKTQPNVLDSVSDSGTNVAANVLRGLGSSSARQTPDGAAFVAYGSEGAVVVESASDDLVPEAHNGKGVDHTSPQEPDQPPPTSTGGGSDKPPVPPETGQGVADQPEEPNPDEPRTGNELWSAAVERSEQGPDFPDTSRGADSGSDAATPPADDRTLSERLADYLREHPETQAGVSYEEFHEDNTPDSNANTGTGLAALVEHEKEFGIAPDTPEGQAALDAAHADLDKLRADTNRMDDWQNPQPDPNTPEGPSTDALRHAARIVESMPADEGVPPPEVLDELARIIDASTPGLQPVDTDALPPLEPGPDYGETDSGIAVPTQPTPDDRDGAGVAEIPGEDPDAEAYDDFDDPDDGEFPDDSDTPEDPMARDGEPLDPADEATLGILAMGEYLGSVGSKDADETVDPDDLASAYGGLPLGNADALLGLSDPIDEGSDDANTAEALEQFQQAAHDYRQTHPDANQEPDQPGQADTEDSEEPSYEYTIKDAFRALAEDELWKAGALPDDPEERKTAINSLADLLRAQDDREGMQAAIDAFAQKAEEIDSRLRAEGRHTDEFDRLDAVLGELAKYIKDQTPSDDNDTPGTPDDQPTPNSHSDDDYFREMAEQQLQQAGELSDDPEVNERYIRELAEALHEQASLDPRLGAIDAPVNTLFSRVEREISRREDEEGLAFETEADRVAAIVALTWRILHGEETPASMLPDVPDHAPDEQDAAVDSPYTYVPSEFRGPKREGEDDAAYRNRLLARAEYEFMRDGRHFPDTFAQLDAIEARADELAALEEGRHRLTASEEGPDSLDIATLLGRIGAEIGDISPIVASPGDKDTPISDAPDDPSRLSDKDYREAHRLEGDRQPHESVAEFEGRLADRARDIANERSSSSQDVGDGPDSIDSTLPEQDAATNEPPRAAGAIGSIGSNETINPWFQDRPEDLDLPPTPPAAALPPYPERPSGEDAPSAETATTNVPPNSFVQSAAAEIARQAREEGRTFTDDDDLETAILDLARQYATEQGTTEARRDTDGMDTLGKGPARNPEELTLASSVPISRADKREARLRLGPRGDRSAFDYAMAVIDLAVEIARERRANERRQAGGR